MLNEDSDRTNLSKKEIELLLYTVKNQKREIESLYSSLETLRELQEYEIKEIKNKTSKASRIIDVFIVFAPSKQDAIDIQAKFKKMGFCNSTDFINDKSDCFYVAQIILSADGKEAVKYQAWGREEVSNTKHFLSLVIKKEVLMAM